MRAGFSASTHDRVPIVRWGRGSLDIAVQTDNLLSLAYLTVDGAAPVEQIEAAAAAGFDAAGLRIQAPRQVAMPHVVIGNRPLIREIKSARERTGVHVLDIEVFTLSADATIEAFLPALETSAEIGASYVQAVSEDPDRQRAVDGFAALCDAAAGFGLRVALEFMRFRHLQTIEAASALVAAAGRSNAGVLVDALHLSRSGGSPAAVAALPPERIAYLQLCDAPAEAPPFEELVREARNDRLHPGEGALWLDELLDALPANVAISVEVPRSLDARRSAKERAMLAGNAARVYLAQYRARFGE
jgi:sugar phosphate isomerase/epimerase